MPAPLIGIAAGVAARAVAKKLATKTAKKVVKKVAEPKSAVKVVKPKTNIERKSLNAMEQTRVNITKSGALARETSKPIIVKNARGQVIPPRISGARQTVKINTNPTKPKGVFGPLKKQLDISSGAAKRRSVANAKALKGLKPLKTKKK
jgi:multidrug efflux pump subunit AcrB